jgi:hypothetical protein
MLEANIKIIESLKCFLNTVVKEADVRSLFTTLPTDFSRQRKLPLNKLVGMLINLPKRSLDIELQAFFESVEASTSDVDCTKAAFSLQRTKLKPLFFQLWNQVLTENFYTYYGNQVKRWQGFRLLAVDGSNMSMVPTAEVIAHFGSATNQFSAVPMARAMQIHDVLNDMRVWADIFPYTDSELSIITSHLKHLPPDSLTLFDRGFASYSLMYLLMNEEIPRHFLIRCKTDFCKEVKQFVNSSKKDIITNLYPSRESIARLKEHHYIVTSKTGIQVRMVKVQLADGQTEVLLTNLYDTACFTTRMIAKLYASRWVIEGAYNTQKNQLQIEIFSGHRVVCIEQDYAAALFVANLQSILEKQCEQEVSDRTKHRRYRYRVNRNISWALLKNRIVKLFMRSTDSRAILMELQYLFSRYLEPVRPGRKVPRGKPSIKRGKYQTLTNYRRAI